MEILNQLSAIRTGATSNFATACLTLAVGIEALVEGILVEDDALKPSCSELESVREHMGKWNGPKNLKDRLMGFLGLLGKVSADAKLRKWAERFGIDQSLVTSWKQLRNPTAHGDSPSGEQQDFDLYYSSVELMYRLVASAIGYDGPLRQTSKSGWPFRNSSDPQQENPL